MSRDKFGGVKWVRGNGLGVYYRFLMDKGMDPLLGLWGEEVVEEVGRVHAAYNFDFLFRFAQCKPY